MPGGMCGVGAGAAGGGGWIDAGASISRGISTGGRDDDMNCENVKELKELLRSMLPL